MDSFVVVLRCGGGGGVVVAQASNISRPEHQANIQT